MMEIKAKTLNLEGTNYEIGKTLGNIVALAPEMKSALVSKNEVLSPENFKLASDMFDRWCPGLTEELSGFADALDISPVKASYYFMTYLHPRCSQLTLLPSLTKEKDVLMARNYEFSWREEDFTLVKTNVSGKYTHMGTSVMQFGRDEGLNECGLGVTMSSCGFPVGPLEFMRNPAVKGLQFWAVIRSILENCQDVSEALSFLEEMPIAYNINMILADKGGRASLVETLDGRMKTQQIDMNSEKQYLHATNHPHFEEFLQFEGKALQHSLTRYEAIEKFLKAKEVFDVTDLKEMLLTKYPQGLTNHYFEEYFGTTKSLVINPGKGSLDICWGGLKENGWRKYNLEDKMENDERIIHLNLERAKPGFYDFVSI